MSREWRWKIECEEGRYGTVVSLEKEGRRLELSLDQDEARELLDLLNELEDLARGARGDECGEKALPDFPLEEAGGADALERRALRALSRLAERSGLSTEEVVRQLEMGWSGEVLISPGRIASLFPGWEQAEHMAFYDALRNLLTEESLEEVTDRFILALGAEWWASRDLPEPDGNLLEMAPEP